MLDLLKKVILVIEDNCFYDYFGIDFIGIIWVFINLVIIGEKSQGVSMFMQQLVCGFFLICEKIYICKIKEVFIVLYMEVEFFKDEIFEFYLNKIELGYCLFGFGVVVQVYYGKKLNEFILV